ncbi:hypothetical protein L227DRAFT_563139 [Lentinus tigrinus ALCF2SS1-6]|uniref:Uncharacterized protein n=1 Tax=Lentinus tigrinus ALCF2SS1-6 TaxID=1328759 RepID=A0A5C2SDE5_9APHY|nr:hypothetical protein L227DRAFT_563139 [Lentinus tigrinus ALCF2SS1-6]
MSSQPPKSANVKKKKKNPFDDDYIQADLNWFKDKQAVHSEPPISAETQGDSNGEAITTQSPSTVCGSSSYTSAQRPVTLAFELTTEEITQIERWRNRHTSPDILFDVPVAFAGDEAESPMNIVKCGRPAEWPTDSSIFGLLNTTDNCGPPQSIALAPPFIQIYQYRDFSNRVFAVVLHRPTAAQRAELQRFHDQDRMWHEMLDKLGTFDFPVPTLVAPTLPKMSIMNNRCVRDV